MTCTEIRLTDAGLEAARIEQPSPGPGEVVVATRAAIVGPTDLEAPNNRVICGEFSGEIIDVGPGVDRGMIGTAVAVLGFRPGGTCDRCLDGASTACSDLQLRGDSIDGGLANAVLVGAHEVLPLPAGLGCEAAALMHRLARALRAIRRSTGRPGDHVAVLGGGPLALATSLVSLSAGFGRTAFVHDHARCRDAVASNGARAVAPPGNGAGWDELRTWLGGYGPDVVFECGGTPESRLAAIDLTRPAGSVVLVADDATRVPMDINLLVMGDKRVQGARVYTAGEARATLELMARSRIKVSALIGETVEVNAFLAAARNGSLQSRLAGCEATIVRWPRDTAVGA